MEKNKDNSNNNVEQTPKNIIMKNMIKENEIISKVIKNKLNIEEALNELFKIMKEQRNFIENISEEHLMLEKSVNRLNTSIDLLKNKLKYENKTETNNIINANKIQFKPNEAISFSNLMNNKKIMNHTFTKKLKAPTKKGSVSSSSNRYISDTNSNYSLKNKSNIDYDKLIQISVTDFKKRKLKPIIKNKK